MLDLSTQAMFEVYKALPELERKEISTRARERACEAVSKRLTNDISPSQFPHEAAREEVFQFKALMQGSYGHKIKQAEQQLREKGASASHWTLLSDAYSVVIQALGPNRRSERPRESVASPIQSAAAALSMPHWQETRDYWEKDRE